MEYKPTPLNIASVLFILVAIYLMINPGPEGWGFLLALYIIVIAIIALFGDLLIQLIPVKYYIKFLVESLILAVVLLYWFK